MNDSERILRIFLIKYHKLQIRVPLLSLLLDDVMNFRK